MMEHAPTSSAAAPVSHIRPEIFTGEFIATLRKHGVIKAFLFGSFSRGEERPGSDVDLLVTFDREATYGERLFLEDELRRLCGHPVDVMTAIHPAFAPYILPTLVPLPL